MLCKSVAIRTLPFQLRKSMFMLNTKLIDHSQSSMKVSEAKGKCRFGQILPFQRQKICRNWRNRSVYNLTEWVDSKQEPEKVDRLPEIECLKSTVWEWAKGKCQSLELKYRYWGLKRCDFASHLLLTLWSWLTLSRKGTLKNYCPVRIYPLYVCQEERALDSWKPFLLLALVNVSHPSCSYLYRRSLLIIKPQSSDFDFENSVTEL